MKGEIIDLRPFADLLQEERLFRTMVFRAAARILEGRGAVKVIIPE